MFHICIYLRNWGVEGAMCKFLEFLDQHPQRNDLSKLATFESILQRPHSAMEGYLRKRRKDIFGRGSEIPGPCIRRPVPMKVHLIPAQIIHRPPLSFTGDYPETLGLLQ